MECDFHRSRSFLSTCMGNPPACPVTPREQTHIERDTMTGCHHVVSDHGNMPIYQNRAREMHSRAPRIAKATRATTEIPPLDLTFAPTRGLGTAFGAITSPRRGFDEYARRAGRPRYRCRYSEVAAPGRRRLAAPQMQINAVVPTCRARTETVATRSTLFHTAIPASTTLNLISPNFCVLSSSCNPGVYVYFY